MLGQNVQMSRYGAHVGPKLSQLGLRFRSDRFLEYSVCSKADLSPARSTISPCAGDFTHGIPLFFRCLTQSF